MSFWKRLFPRSTPPPSIPKAEPLPEGDVVAIAGTLPLDMAFDGLTAMRLAFSPDSRTLALAGSGYSGEGLVQLHNLVNGNKDVRKVTDIKGANHIAFSPDGEMLALAGEDGRVVCCGSGDDQTLFSVAGHQATVWSVSFDPTGALVASASSDGTVKIWGARNGKLRKTLTAHSETVFAAVFSPDGSTLATAGGADQDYAIRLWSMPEGKKTAELHGHRGIVYDLAFSEDAARLASAGGMGHVRI